MSTAMNEIRRIRDELLAECDWTLLPSSPLSAEKQNEWKVYRQALRDMPATYADETDIDNVVWPTRPS